MTQTNSPIAQDQVLNDDELNAVSGGDAMSDARNEMQTLQLLMTTVSDVLKNVGQALQGAARKA